MSLETGESYLGLPVCKQCGWPMTDRLDREDHEQCTMVEAGKAATALANKLHKIPSTKFGYGTGRLSFKPAADITITFTFTRNGVAWIDRVWLTGTVDADRAVALVQAITDWSKR